MLKFEAKGQEIEALFLLEISEKTSKDSFDVDFKSKNIHNSSLKNKRGVGNKVNYLPVEAHNLCHAFLRQNLIFPFLQLDVQ